VAEGSNLTTRGRASIATTTPRRRHHHLTAATIASAGIAAAVIPGMAVTTEPAMIAAFAAGIGASRTVMARPFAVPISQHDPANEKRAGHGDQRQQLVLHRRGPLKSHRIVRCTIISEHCWIGPVL
jgi:hypothetical protein